MFRVICILLAIVFVDVLISVGLIDPFIDFAIIFAIITNTLALIIEDSDNDLKQFYIFMWQMAFICTPMLLFFRLIDDSSILFPFAGHIFFVVSLLCGCAFISGVLDLNKKDQDRYVGDYSYTKTIYIIILRFASICTAIMMFVDLYNTEIQYKIMAGCVSVICLIPAFPIPACLNFNKKDQDTYVEDDYYDYNAGIKVSVKDKRIVEFLDFVRDVAFTIKYEGDKTGHYLSLGKLLKNSDRQLRSVGLPTTAALESLDTAIRDNSAHVWPTIIDILTAAVNFCNDRYQNYKPVIADEIFDQLHTTLKGYIQLSAKDKCIIQFIDFANDVATNQNYYFSLGTLLENSDRKLRSVGLPTTTALKKLNQAIRDNSAHVWPTIIDILTAAVNFCNDRYCNRKPVIANETFDQLKNTLATYKKFAASD